MITDVRRESGLELDRLVLEHGTVYFKLFVDCVQVPTGILEGDGERKQNMVCMCPKTQTKNLLIIDIIMSNCNKGLFIIIQKDEIG